MESLFKILIYEKDRNLNSILLEQLSYFSKYEICLIEDQINLFKNINEKSFDACILNLDDFEGDIFNFMKIFQNINNHQNIIIYQNDIQEKEMFFQNDVICLEKPFTLKKLFNYLKNIKYSEDKNNIKIYLTENLIFLPDKKFVENKITNIKQRLTEKETNLLKFIYKNKNSEISKKQMLINVWGINDNINTHTLETHLYRLKQKLYKLEPELIFSLINQNGNYIFNSVV